MAGGGGDYARKRIIYQDISGSLSVTTATDDTTLVTARNANYTIYIQKIFAQVTAASATTWTLKDSAGTPVSITGALSTASAPVSFNIDFGDNGVALSAGKNFLLDVGATGAAGQIVWEGYMRLTPDTATAVASV